MRILGLFCALIFFSDCYSQNLRQKIQGQWVCTKIVDSAGNLSAGKYGESQDYLKFCFYDDKLSISTTPFDIGNESTVNYKNNLVDLYPGAVYDFGEMVYQIESVNNKQLVLSSKTKQGAKIIYEFNNAFSTAYSLINQRSFLDEGVVIVKHLKSSKKDNGANKTSDYQLFSDSTKQNPSPTYIDRLGGHFSDDFSYQFSFPKSFRPDTISNELILDCEIGENGLENIRIAQGIHEEIDALTIKIMEKLKTKWQPVKFNNIILKQSLRFHFVFYLGRQLF